MTGTTRLADAGGFEDILQYRFILLDLDARELQDPLETIRQVRGDMMLNVPIFCFGGTRELRDAARQARALELLAAIADHPAAWHVCQVRARRLIDELRRDVPVDMAETAIARGQQLDWQASVAPVLEDLAGPAPMPAARWRAQNSDHVHG